MDPAWADGPNRQVADGFLLRSYGQAVLPGKGFVMTRQPPQPDVDRLTPFSSHPIVVGVVPGQPELVARTAMSLAEATDCGTVYFAYADPSRYVREEYEDGSVRHESMNSDGMDDEWRERSDQIQRQLAQILEGSNVRWEFRYLAGRPDRALTHLARTVDAAVIVVGTKAAERGLGVLEFFEGSVSVHLSQHQHRPVLTVPLSVVDWKDASSKWDR